MKSNMSAPLQGDTSVPGLSSAPARKPSAPGGQEQPGGEHELARHKGSVASPRTFSGLPPLWAASVAPITVSCSAPRRRRRRR